ncbi:MAG: hypothetical protein Q4A46_01940 [Clostridia bacterium]|nr:hypothetical protein [Clostridia bacterium]
MEESKKPRRKTGGLIAKNLIILLVLAVVAFIAIWAWFTKNLTATASGVSVKTRADGIEVSWDGKDYYKDLTAVDPQDIKDEVGPAKNLTGNSEPLKLSLVTGNGINFFEPKLNRKTGVPLKNSDGSWKGTDINENNSSGKYVDIDLYFRSTMEKSIYLANDSTVSPKNTADRKSGFGDFSKDYICAASRLAFLNKDKNNCNFIWAPNSNYELRENSGYTKIAEKKTAIIENPDAGSIGEYLTDNDNKTYYIWLPVSYDTDQQSQMHLKPAQMKFETFDTTSGEAKGLFTYEIDLNLNPRTIRDIPVVINNNSSTITDSDLSNIDREKSYATRDTSDIDPKVEISQQDFILYDGKQAAKFYINGFNETTLRVKLGYNPKEKLLVMLSYSGGNPEKSYDRTGNIGSTELEYYEIENNVKAVLASPEHSLAVSKTSAEYSKAIGFKSSEKNTIVPSSVSLSEQFRVIKTGESYNATYKFENANGEELAISNGKISFGSSGTEFSLAVFENFDGPAICYGNLYLVMKNGSLQLVDVKELNLNDLVTVYVGSSYELLTNSSKPQEYRYYDKTSKSTVVLGENTTPKLFSSPSYDPTQTVTTVGGNVAVATLTKAKSTDEYYTAHIIMRVWVEGTDRDALIPLADGIFNMSLHFISK